MTATLQQISSPANDVLTTESNHTAHISHDLPMNNVKDTDKTKPAKAQSLNLTEVVAMTKATLGKDLESFTSLVDQMEQTGASIQRERS